MALIECPECGGKVSNSAVSCPHCGFPIKARLRNEGPFCPHCGSKNEPSSIYCRHCGKAMNGESADSFVLFQQSDPKRDINVIALEGSAKLSKQKAQETQTALQAESVRLEQERFESMAKCPRINFPFWWQAGFWNREGRSGACDCGSCWAPCWWRWNAGCPGYLHELWLQI